MSGPRRRSYGGTYKKTPPYPVSPNEKKTKMAIISSLNTSKPAVYSQREIRPVKTVSPRRFNKSRENYSKSLKEATQIADSISPSPSPSPPLIINSPLSPTTTPIPHSVTLYDLPHHHHTSASHTPAADNSVHSVYSLSSSNSAHSFTRSPPTLYSSCNSPPQYRDSFDNEDSFPHYEEYQRNADEPYTPCNLDSPRNLDSPWDEVHVPYSPKTEEIHSYTEETHSHTEETHFDTDGDFNNEKIHTDTNTKETHTNTIVTHSHTDDTQSHHSTEEPHTEETQSHTNVETHSHTNVETHSHTKVETHSHTKVETHFHTNVETHSQSTNTEKYQQNEALFNGKYSSLSEYLAFSEEPIGLQSILSVHGVSYKELPPPKTSPQIITNIKRPATTPAVVTTKGQLPQFQTLHDSVHQFCINHTLPQLPLQLQILSRITHSFPLSFTTDSHYDNKWSRGSDRLTKTRETERETEKERERERGGERERERGGERERERERERGGERGREREGEREREREAEKRTESGKSDKTKRKGQRLLGSTKNEEIKTERKQTREETRQQTREKKEEEKTDDREGVQLEVCGITIPSEYDPMRQLWTPAPPKLSLHPLTIKQHLFPKHLLPLHEENEEGGKEENRETVADEVIKSSVTIETEEEEEEEEEHMSPTKIAIFDSYEEYKMIINEVLWQREQLCDYYRKKAEQEMAELKRKQQQQLDEDGVPLSESQISSVGSSSMFTSSSLIKRSLRKGAGQRRGGVAVPNATGRPLRQTRSALLRAQYLRTEVSKPVRRLVRCISTNMNLNECDQKIFVCEEQNVKKVTKTTSVPSLLDEYCTDRSGSMKWADVLWDKWLYQVINEVRDAIAKLEKGQLPDIIWKPRTNKRKENRDQKEGIPLETVKMEVIELADIQPIPSINDYNVETEITRLTNQIEALKGHDDKKVKLAELLTSRGALYRKYGRLEEAKTDLLQSLELSQSLVDTHWELHLLLLVQGKEKEALEQITQLLKKDRKHTMGYISKGSLLAKKGDISDAVNNYTQAIWLEENNPRLHFLRAELREKRGETETAMGDYATVVKLQPHNEEALIRQAKHKFNKSLWIATCHALTTLLEVNHSNTEAWLLRSQANLKMNDCEAALKDLSSAIHLNPDNPLLFYQRGCLLRKYNPDKALLDFSISILLDSSKQNALAYLHRGVVYTQLKCYDEALSDFITAGVLNPSLASAHTNTGLVLMKHYKKYKSSIKYYTQSLTADPTYIRALLCKAEALTYLNQFKAAVVDWSRAIHVTPNDTSLHLSQGRIYLLLKDYTSANNCIKIASKLDTEMGKSHSQKALIYSFLGEHKKAISTLQSHLKGGQLHYLYTVLGKIYLRAEQYKESVTSFKQALKYLEQGYASGNNNSKITELHYLCGQSLLKEFKYKQAAEEFGLVVSTEPNNVLGHYYRGLSLLKQGQGRGLFPINQSLVLQPSLVKAYLTRASYYGLDGRISKAIMNCSEAISLEPKSVRAYLYRGVLRHKIGYNKAAIDDLSMALSLNPIYPTVVLFNRAVCYQEINENHKALRDYSCILLIEDIPNIKVLINRGLLYISLEDHFNALKDFMSAKMLRPDDPSLFQAIAYCSHRLGRLEDAIKSYSIALSLDSMFIEAMIGRGNVYTEYLSDKGNKKAKLDYTKVIHQYPSCLPARVNLALVLQCEGQFMTAWRQLTNILATNKQYTPALEARSIISLQMGNTFGALVDMTQAINYQPTPLYYTERGTIHYYTGDSINAVRDFEKALQLDSNYILAHYNMGNVLLQQRLYGQACDRFSIVLNISPRQDEALINRALCYIALGMKDKALNDFDLAIEYNPYAAHAYLNRGNLYKIDGMYTLAEKDYLKALELQPEDVLSLKYHAEVLSYLGRKQEAKEQFMKAAHVEIT